MLYPNHPGRFPARFVAALALALGAGLLGCGDYGKGKNPNDGKQAAPGPEGAAEKPDPNKAILTGTVSYKGQPLPGGTIDLHREGDKRVPSAPIHPDGTYLLTAVPPGKWAVTIETESIKAVMPPTDKLKLPKGVEFPKLPPGLPRYVPIPEKYAKPATSDLTVELKPGKQEENFELKD
jgi:hypothetical protein